MSDASELLDVGRIGKAHGLRGEVVVTLSTDMVDQRTAPGSQLWDGETWLVVASTRPHQDKWLYRFEGFDDRTQAETLRGKVLSAEPLESEGEVWAHRLVGARLFDQHGTDHGPVVSIVANPASDLIELDGGRLVPLNFFVSHDDGIVRVDVPPGLLDDDAIETPR